MGCRDAGEGTVVLIHSQDNGTSVGDMAAKVARQKFSCLEWLPVSSRAERASWEDLNLYPRIHLLPGKT